ncbi:MAG: hypothetical protein EP336_12955 [Rhodobacteraceae bacterium]|nr:MAG: hypothetical protein EP336_12955 [Paracoccaceae bacterium]
MSDHDAAIWLYHFDRTENFYLGKTKAEIDPRSGTPMMPQASTLVAPPSEWSKGCIPVFNGSAWEIHKDEFWRPREKEVNYDAGRKAETYKPKVIALNDFPDYPSLHHLANSCLVVMRLVDNVRFVDAKFQQLLRMDFSPVENIIDDAAGGVTLCAKPTSFGTYKFESEALVFQMRHCLDTLCRLTELLCDAERVNREKRFRCDSVGALFGTQKNSQAANIVRGLSRSYESDQTDFLKISNDLFNAIKHTHMNAEAQRLFGADVPTIVAYGNPTGRQRDIIPCHNHNVYHLMMGFHDTIDRILSNQRVFLTS